MISAIPCISCIVCQNTSGQRIIPLNKKKTPSHKIRKAQGETESSTVKRHFRISSRLNMFDL